MLNMNLFGRNPAAIGFISLRFWSADCDEDLGKFLIDLSSASTMANYTLVI